MELAYFRERVQYIFIALSRLLVGDHLKYELSLIQISLVLAFGFLDSSFWDPEGLKFGHQVQDSFVLLSCKLFAQLLWLFLLQVFVKFENELGVDVPLKKPNFRV